MTYLYHHPLPLLSHGSLFLVKAQVIKKDREGGLPVVKAANKVLEAEEISL